MKYYSMAKAKSYIWAQKENLKEAYLGMHEDWGWTAEQIWVDGNFVEKFKMLGDSVTVAGIEGSAWATPAIELVFKDGSRIFHECSSGESSGKMPNLPPEFEIREDVQKSIPPLGVKVWRFL